MPEQISTSNMLKKGTILHGVYRIENYLSSGGFGNTYVAANMEFEETVAIKEFFMRGVTQRDANNTTVSVSNSENIQQFEEQLEKFKKEARRLRRLKNEHIVRVHDLFEENGTAYYVMDYIEGESLAERLKRVQQPISEEEVKRIIMQVLDALDTVHSEGLWHLDLKPANIMIDRQGNVQLIDFGASKQQSHKGGATSSSAVSFTNGFAPREQMEQNLDKFGPWTDFYALGATLYNLLTNRKPPMPSDINDDSSSDKHFSLPMVNVSAPMQKVILKLMSTNRFCRPQSVEDIRELIVSSNSENKDKIICEEETIISQKRMVSQKKKRNRLRSWLIISIILILLAGLCSYFFKNYSIKASTGNLVIDNLINNMVKVEGGTFIMGYTFDQDEYERKAEKPAHQVTLSSFYIGRFEVTQEEWEAVMGNNPSYFKGAKRPVECVSWNDCQSFINKLNEMTGKTFRLPTEAEWEFAARGGNKSNNYKFSGSNDPNEVGWYYENCGYSPLKGGEYFSLEDLEKNNNQTHPVGMKSPNELGLFDMSGNVNEWCSDKSGPRLSKYSSSSQTNPKGPSSGSDHIFRGGSWYFSFVGSSVSSRHQGFKDRQDERIGFRLAL